MRAAGSSFPVVENPVIDRAAFEGNKKIKDEQLSAEVQSKSRGTLSRPMVQSDALRIAEIYRHSGRYDVHVTPEIIERSNNRVDLVSLPSTRREDRDQDHRVHGEQQFLDVASEGLIKTHRDELPELPRRRQHLRP